MAGPGQALLAVLETFHNACWELLEDPNLKNLPAKFPLQPNAAAIHYLSQANCWSYGSEGNHLSK